MKKEQKQYLLNESHVNKDAMRWLVGVMVCSGIAGGISGARTLDGKMLLLVLGITAVMLGLGFGLAYVLFIRKVRLYMDEQGLWIHMPLQKDRPLLWKDIRTAAIVNLQNMNYPTMIVLSVNQPAETLTRKRMVWKNTKRGQELRIWHSESRQAVVEQMLHMTLPEIVL